MAPKDFLPATPGSGTAQRNGAAAAAAKRERMYQGVIWVLVIWNLCLQARSLSRDTAPSLAVPSTTIDAAEFRDATQQLDADPVMPTVMPPSVTGSFAEPSLVPEAFGSAGVVCSGCADAGSNASAPVPGSNASAPMGNLSSSAGGSFSDGSSSSSSAGSSDGVGSTTAPTTPSPLETAALGAADQAVAKRAAAAAAVSAGKKIRDPIFVPGPPIPAGLPEGAACSSAFKGDASVAQCNAFCIGKFARAHCGRCKCRSCSFCPLDPSSSAAATGAAGGAGGPNATASANQTATPP